MPYSGSEKLELINGKVVQIFHVTNSLGMNAFLLANEVFTKDWACVPAGLAHHVIYEIKGKSEVGADAQIEVINDVVGGAVGGMQASLRMSEKLHASRVVARTHKNKLPNICMHVGRERSPMICSTSIG